MWRSSGVFIAHNGECWKDCWLKSITTNNYNLYIARSIGYVWDVFISACTYFKRRNGYRVRTQSYNNKIHTYNIRTQFRKEMTTDEDYTHISVAIRIMILVTKSLQHQKYIIKHRLILYDYFFSSAIVHTHSKRALSCVITTVSPLTNIDQL